MALKIGALLLEDGRITPEQLEEALAYQKAHGGRLGRALVQLGHLGDDDIAAAIARKYALEWVDLRDCAPDPALLRLVPAQTARRYQVLPLSASDTRIRLAMADPTNVIAMDDVRFMTGCTIEPVAASEGAVANAIERSYGPPAARARRRQATGGSARGAAAASRPSGGDEAAAWEPTLDEMAAHGGLAEIDLDALAAEPEPEDAREEIDIVALSQSADAPPVVKLMNVIFVDALRRRATHVLVEPYEREFRVRFRIDGVLYNVMALPMRLREPLTSRIKTMAAMDLSERRLPQTGQIRIRMVVGDRRRELTYRTTVFPTLWGETVVLEVLDAASLILQRDQLGFEPGPLASFERVLGQAHGLVLVVGPARSGRTNTLYSALGELNRPERHIVAVEEQVGFSLPGINQVRVRPAAGLTHSAILRLLPQCDADVVLVDGVRGPDAAQGAVRAAAACGPLVLASLDETDAPAAVATLADASGEPYLLAKSLRLVIAQRLVLRLCTGCRVDRIDEGEEEALRTLGLPEGGSRREVRGRGEGCRDCDGFGFRGRTGLFEVMEIAGTLRDLIARGAPSGEIRARALEEEALFTLGRSGIEKVRQGITTASAVLSASSS